MQGQGHSFFLHPSMHCFFNAATQLICMPGTAGNPIPEEIVVMDAFAAVQVK